MLGTLLIFIGGGIGSVLRYSISLLAIRHLTYPHYGTLLINIIGSLFLGFVIATTIHKPDLVHPNLKLFLAVGIAGGFTTFSTFSVEMLMLFKQGQFIQALLYMIFSPILGLLAAYLGFLTVK